MSYGNKTSWNGLLYLYRDVRELGYSGGCTHPAYRSISSLDKSRDIDICFS